MTGFSMLQNLSSIESIILILFMLQYWYISWLLIFLNIFFCVYFLFFFFFFLFGDSYQYIGVYIHFVCINICILLIKNNISKIKKKVLSIQIR